MKNIVIGLVVIAAGIILVIFRKPFVEYTVTIQVASLQTPLGRKLVNIGYWLVPLFGLLVAIIGLLILASFFKVKV